jgi:DNA-binding NtrC family response regulator
MSYILCVGECKNKYVLHEQDLSLEGHETIIAADGNDAFETVETRQPDIIVMDVCTLSMRGIKIMCSIVSKHRDIPLIIYTAYSSYKDVFMSWYPDAYIVKSSDLTELKNKIKELLEKEAVAV